MSNTTTWEYQVWIFKLMLNAYKYLSIISLLNVNNYIYINVIVMDKKYEFFYQTLCRHLFFCGFDDVVLLAVYFCIFSYL